MKCPMLFIQGTRDALCDLELLQAVLKPVTAPTILHVTASGDHSFKLLKIIGGSEHDVC
ncbi:MAG: alpha/beta family hydrolase [Gammaproteobacteria bacterium]